MLYATEGHVQLNVLGLVALATTMLTACDGYTYEGRDGQQNLTMADAMSLPDAYSFYVETYKGTSPPMLDVAKTFRRFGPQGTAYLAQRALGAGDPEEFEAATTALLILGYSCPAGIAQALETKRRQLSADGSSCSQSV